MFACAVLAGACDKSERTAEISPVDEATQNYGFGMVPNPAVTYQPEVIVVGGGPKAIRSASADGLVWIIDGHAPNAQDLRPGKIMLATSRATGRIMSVEPRGGDLAVTLGPIHLGEVLRDADIKVDVEFNSDSMVYQTVPELPGMYRDLKASSGQAAPAVYAESNEPAIEEDTHGILVRLAPIRLAVANTNLPTGDFPRTTKMAPKISVRGWEIEPSIKKETPVNAGPNDAKRADRSEDSARGSRTQSRYRSWGVVAQTALQDSYGVSRRQARS